MRRVVDDFRVQGYEIRGRTWRVAARTLKPLPIRGAGIKKARWSSVHGE